MAPRDEKHLRGAAIFVLKNVWAMSESTVKEIVGSVQSGMDSNSQKEALQDSLLNLTRIITTLGADTEYEKKELQHSFGDLIGNLHHVFKKLFTSLAGDIAKSQWIPNPGQARTPPLWYIENTLFDEFARGLNLESRRKVMQGYPPISIIARYLRNINEHYDDLPDGELPLDHITGVRTCGNVYTLVSIIVLAIYAYIEILSLWDRVN